MAEKRTQEEKSQVAGGANERPPFVGEAQVQRSPIESPAADAEAFSCRQNFTAEVENAINRQINYELDASYRYMAMANYFARPTVALAGAARFFVKQSLQERSHAQKLIDYQNARGGKVTLLSLESPPRQQWGSLLEAFVDALELEKANNDALLRLHEIASDKTDPDLTNFLEEFYLKEQVAEIEKMTRFANQLRRVGVGLGEYIWDQELLHGQAQGLLVTGNLMNEKKHVFD